MYKRELYLRQIRPFYRNEQIKILMGVRRCGKTELLKMIQQELSMEVDDRHIVYLSFELLENKPYRNPSVLYPYLQSQIKDDAMHFIFLDEVQFVEDWPEVVNSLKVKYRNISIFLTGSNSDLLSDDKESRTACRMCACTKIFMVIQKRPRRNWRRISRRKRA